MGVEVHTPGNGQSWEISIKNLNQERAGFCNCKTKLLIGQRMTSGKGSLLSSNSGSELKLGDASKSFELINESSRLGNLSNSLNNIQSRFISPPPKFSVD